MWILNCDSSDVITTRSAASYLKNTNSFDLIKINQMQIPTAAENMRVNY